MYHGSMLTSTVLMSPSWRLTEMVMGRVLWLSCRVSWRRGGDRGGDRGGEGGKRMGCRCISFAGTLAAVQQYDRQQAEETLPALKQCLSQAAQGMAKCTTVQQTLQEWSVCLVLFSPILAMQDYSTLSNYAINISSAACNITSLRRRVPLYQNIALKR